ncbi:MAG: hypothetical protein UY63_C0005G0072 [Parcubacteria group bacterium GW2011_GWA2_51_10]|nr:MAG: hypothetical protein UY63_C0005G0072 [Parcubacteria group bacterium GW2011_GWA2_51_10]
MENLDKFQNPLRPRMPDSMSQTKKEEINEEQAREILGAAADEDESVSDIAHLDKAPDEDPTGPDETVH